MLECVLGARTSGADAGVGGWTGVIARMCVCGGCRWEVREGGSPSYVQRQSVQSCSPHTTNTTPSHTPLFSPPPPPLSLRPPSSPALAQPLTQSEFYAATWEVVNSPSTSVTKWGPIEDWDTSGVPSFEFAFATRRNEAGDYLYKGNPKAAAFTGDISKWITSSVTEMGSTFLRGGGVQRRHQQMDHVLRH